MKTSSMRLKTLNYSWLIFSTMSVFLLNSCRKSTELYPGVATFSNASVNNTQDGLGLVVDFSLAGINGVSDFDSVGYVYTIDNVVYKEIFPDSMRLYSRFVSGKGAKSFSGQTYGIGLNSTILVRPAVSFGGRLSFGEEKSIVVSNNGFPKTTQSQFIEQRNQMTCIAGSEGVLMGGGIIVNTQNQLTSFYKMDPAAGSIAPVTDIPGNAGCVGPMGYYRGGKYYLMGGKSNGLAIDKIWSYDAVADVWAEEGTFPGGACFAGFTASSGNYLLAGCYRNASEVPTATVYKMDASGQSWNEIKSPPADFKARSHASAFIVGDYLYITGGAANSYVELKDMWKVNLITEEWTRLPDAPLKFYGAPAFAFDDIAYLGMGVIKDDTGKGRKDLVLGFDTQTEQWFLYADGNVALTSGQHVGCGFKINNKGYLISTVQSPASIHQVR